MTIKTRQDYLDYLEADLRASNLARWSFSLRFRRPEVLYVRVLRRVELLRQRSGPVARVQRFYFRYQLTQLSVRLGISIHPGVFGPGLSIPHYGSIVVNAGARIGAYCRIHSATTIGLGPSGVPTIGDYVYIGPGAVVYGGVHVGDQVVIGANAVVGRDVPSGVTVAGAPARIISRRGSADVMPPFVPVPGRQDA